MWSRPLFFPMASSLLHVRELLFEREWRERLVHGLGRASTGDAGQHDEKSDHPESKQFHDYLQVLGEAISASPSLSIIAYPGLFVKLYLGDRKRALYWALFRDCIEIEY